eukprot:CAMPEP_0175812578 /NCGR_PEP_ID=MMETSP0107_2-20121207/4450_1 /TAXON_ID=195067 ORGANISM="Goniomonas pacifica, Strain CCMP1869" /NCGR_SAMPLE_ID=MMETSP0107_2 /ASSEMBLY_ACC=CAM_ASM_000203 /LENGTH=39 /DNA_ID= /DNA_START= /DNA_END= /DNA_ORIENTATION=
MTARRFSLPPCSAAARSALSSLGLKIGTSSGTWKLRPAG